jgi:hypothetical protein
VPSCLPNFRSHHSLRTQNQTKFIIINFKSKPKLESQIQSLPRPLPSTDRSLFISAAPYCRRSLQLSLHRREEDEMKRERSGKNKKEEEELRIQISHEGPKQELLNCCLARAPLATSPSVAAPLPRSPSPPRDSLPPQSPSTKHPVLSQFHRDPPTPHHHLQAASSAIQPLRHYSCLINATANLHHRTCSSKQKGRTRGSDAQLRERSEEKEKKKKT